MRNPPPLIPPALAAVNWSDFWDTFWAVTLVVVLVAAVPLWPVTFLVLCWHANDGVDLRINDPVLDHRDHLATGNHPRVSQGQGSGII